MANWLDEKGTMKEQINEIERRTEGMTVEMMKMTKKEELGKMSTEARLTIFQRTVVPTMKNNLECWTKITKKEIERLERIPGQMLRRLLRIPGTTSFMGILRETGIWTMEMQVLYQRMMLYQCIMTADDERLGKKVVMAQEEGKYPGWPSETKKLARRIGIEIEFAKKRLRADGKRSERKDQTRTRKAVE